MRNVRNARPVRERKPRAAWSVIRAAREQPPSFELGLRVFLSPPDANVAEHSALLAVRPAPHNILSNDGHLLLYLTM